MGITIPVALKKSGNWLAGEYRVYVVTFTTVNSFVLL